MIDDFEKIGISISRLLKSLIQQVIARLWMHPVMKFKFYSWFFLYRQLSSQFQCGRY